MKARIKEKLQAYLRGEREGFSLVELIIVIAIMAILIGVIALAVIPYLAKSKESKDLSTLDNISSALKTAVADTKAQGSYDFKYTGTKTSGTNEWEKVNDAMVDVLGKGSVKLVADANKDACIRCFYDATNNQLVVYASETSSAGGAASSMNSATLSKYNETNYTSAGVASNGGKAFVVAN